MEGVINGEGQNFSEGGFVKILAGGGPPVPPTTGNPDRDFKSCQFIASDESDSQSGFQVITFLFFWR